MTTDLALSITKNINSSEFTILLILIILFTTIFFCHGLIRLCMIMVKRGSGSGNEDEERALRPPMPEMFGPGGYAIPRRPIRVVLARDEEAAGIESEAQAGKINPPAYGIWRESVVRVPGWGLSKLCLDANYTASESTLTASTGNATTSPSLRRPRMAMAPGQLADL